MSNPDGAHRIGTIHSRLAELLRRGAHHITPELVSESTHGQAFAQVARRAGLVRTPFGYWVPGVGTYAFIERYIARKLEAGRVFREAEAWLDDAARRSHTRATVAALATADAERPPWLADQLSAADRRAG